VIVNVDSGGRTRAVSVTRDNGRFLVSLDGREYIVDVHDIGGVWSLIIGPAEGGLSEQEHPGRGEPLRSYEVAFVKGSGGAMMVHVNGQPVPVRPAPSRLARDARGTGAPAEGAGPQRITAPMPGKVVKVLVKAGDRVEARHGLVVVEAMKMENELRARAPGTVVEVRVAEGASVEAGAILVVVE
jgi:biotin carboxyl carrier protein